MKEDGNFIEFRWDIKSGIFTESKAQRTSIKVATRYSILLKD